MIIGAVVIGGRTGFTLPDSGADTGEGDTRRAIALGGRLPTLNKNRGYLQDGVSWCTAGTSVPRRPSHHPLTSLLRFVCVPQTDTSSSYLPVDSTHTAVGRFRSLVRRSGTRYLTSSEIRRVVLTVLSSFLGQSSTNVTSALEVFLNNIRHINPRFTYLLTFYLYRIQKCDSLSICLQINFLHPFPPQKKK